MNTVVVRPATSWMSLLGGWIATIGAAALVAPAVAAVLAGVNPGNNDITPAVPVIIGIFVSYLIGGYVAGRMAGYRTSWHGMLTAFFGLFVLLVLVLVSYAAASGALAGIGVNNLTGLVPGATGLNIDSVGNALTFGALLGFLAAIVGGWLGGVLAPAHAEIHAVAPYTARERGPVVGRTVGVGPVGTRSVKREAVIRRPPILPAFGRKGGDRVREQHIVEERRETDIEAT